MPISRSAQSPASSITRIDPLADPRWDEFVARHPRGTVWYSSAWLRVTQRTYGYLPAHLACEVGGLVEGILPLVLVRSRLTGNRLVSLPFSGPVGPIGASPRVVTALTEAAVDLRAELGCRYVSLNTTEDLRVSEPYRLAVTQPFVCSILQLADAPETIWRTRLRKQLRADIRRAQRQGVSVKLADRRADLADFYELYLHTSRRHGLPPQPRRLFDEMWEAFSGDGKIELLQARVGERLIAAQLCLSFKDVFSIVYAGIDYRSLHYSPVKLMDWFAIELASARGYGSIDFLQSHVRNAGLRWYKRGFGTAEVPVKYHYNPLVGSTNTLREVLVGSRTPLPKLIKALVRRVPSAGLELLGRLVFKHVG